LEFGGSTPYQTLLKHNNSTVPPQVLSPVIANIMREVMQEVVDNGTAKRAANSYRDVDGKPIAIGGKTGTGDQRYDEFSVGGHMVSSRVLNRTGTFAFYIGDRFFGTITAHVAGEQAACAIWRPSSIPWSMARHPRLLPRKCNRRLKAASLFLHDDSISALKLFGYLCGIDAFRTGFCCFSR
jgi:hypothetical protein